MYNDNFIIVIIMIITLFYMKYVNNFNWQPGTNILKAKFIDLGVTLIKFTFSHFDLNHIIIMIIIIYYMNWAEQSVKYVHVRIREKL